MEIKISTQQILNGLCFLSALIFVGLCIEAGGFLTNSIYTLAFNPIGAKYFWNHLDMSSLYAFDKGHFFAETTFMNIVVILKAILFWVIVKFLYKKKLDLSKPFSNEMRQFILLIGYISLGISLFSSWGSSYTNWLIGKDVVMPPLKELRLESADVWLFMSVALFVIALIFKRGIEIQTENDLTV
ncbi:MAG: hypothetical protein WCP74_02070 [Sphingobacteriia bacterium]|jgi:hypothetical protein